MGQPQNKQSSLQVDSLNQQQSIDVSHVAYNFVFSPKIKHFFLRVIAGGTERERDTVRVSSCVYARGTKLYATCHTSNDSSWSQESTWRELYYFLGAPSSHVDFYYFFKFRILNLFILAPTPSGNFGLGPLKRIRNSAICTIVYPPVWYIAWPNNLHLDTHIIDS